jgi:hypothetical protein
MQAMCVIGGVCGMLKPWMGTLQISITHHWLLMMFATVYHAVVTGASPIVGH